MRHCSEENPLSLTESSPSLVWPCGWTVLLGGARITGNCLHQTTFPLQAASFAPCVSSCVFPSFPCMAFPGLGAGAGSILPVQTVLAADPRSQSGSPLEFFWGSSSPWFSSCNLCTLTTKADLVLQVLVIPKVSNLLPEGVLNLDFLLSRCCCGHTDTKREG